MEDSSGAAALKSLSVSVDGGVGGGGGGGGDVVNVCMIGVK